MPPCFSLLIVDVVPFGQEYLKLRYPTKISLRFIFLWRFMGCYSRCGENNAERLEFIKRLDEKGDFRCRVATLGIIYYKGV